MTENFWKQKPQPFDLRALSLLVPGVASAIGFFCFAVLAFSFTELAQLGANFRKVLVVVGAFCLAFGGEIGTLSTAVEVHRKERQGTALIGDRWALRVSIGATLGEFLIAFATLLGVKAKWSIPVQEYGVIGLGLLAVLDAYAGFKEFGYYLGEYDERLASWEQARDQEAERLYQRDLRRDARRDNLALNLELDAMKAQGSWQESQGEHQEPVREPPELSKAERKARVLAAFQADPTADRNELAQELGVSYSSIGYYVRELRADGELGSNGHGELIDA